MLLLLLFVILINFIFSHCFNFSVLNFTLLPFIFIVYLIICLWFCGSLIGFKVLFIPTMYIFSCWLHIYIVTRGQDHEDTQTEFPAEVEDDVTLRHLAGRLPWGSGVSCRTVTLMGKGYEGATPYSQYNYCVRGSNSTFQCNILQ